MKKRRRELERTHLSGVAAERRAASKDQGDGTLKGEEDDGQAVNGHIL